MTMTKLQISDDLSFPIDAVTQKLAFLGRTGSGKSYAATKLAELMLGAGAQIVCLDPVGVWYGLRIGDRQRFDIPVFGGLHGDIALEPTAGALMADLVVDRGQSMVLDVSQMLDSERARFAAAFAEQFFQRKKARPAACHLYIEECQEFIPQEFQPGEQRMLHCFQRISKIGRNFGIGVSLISQRPQEVNKKALNQTECLFAFQMTGVLERKAIKAWVDEKGLDGDISAQLPKLDVGHAHVWSPQWLKCSKVVKIARKTTADISKTPEVGEFAREMKLKPIDLGQLRLDMAATIEKAKADDPKELRKRIVDLERTLTSALKAKPPTAPKEKRVEVPFIPAKQLAAIERIGNSLAASARVQAETAAGLTRVSEDLLRLAAANVAKTATLGPVIIGARPPVPVQTTNGKVHPVKFVPTTAPRVARSPSNGAGDASLGNSGLRRILIALAQRPQGLTNKQIGVRASLNARSGTFSTYLGRARSNGWIEDRGDTRYVSETGLAALGSYDPLPSGRALLDHWLGELGQSGAARILAALAEAYPETLDNETIGQRANLDSRSGTFSTYMGRLRSLELVEGSRGQTRASSEFFE